MGPLEKDSHRANRSGSSVEVWKQSGSRRWKEPFYPFPKQAMHTESRPHLEEERRKGHTNSFNKKVLFCRYIATILSIWVYVCHTPGLLVKNEKVQWRNLKPASRTLEVDIFFSHTSSEWWILWSREDARRGGLHHKLVLRWNNSDEHMGFITWRLHDRATKLLIGI